MNVKHMKNGDYSKQADMCSFQVDAVVGACKGTLLLDGGLAKALSDAAGPNFRMTATRLSKNGS